MRTVGELIHSIDKEAVLATLAKTYHGTGEDPEGYSDAWDTLLSMQPKLTKLSCVLSRKKFGVDVSGREGDDPQLYAIEFVDWREWLSMPIVIDPSIGDMSDTEQLAHVLYELTWGGYDPETQQAMVDEIDDRIEEIKSTYPDETIQ